MVAHRKAMAKEYLQKVYILFTYEHMARDNNEIVWNVRHQGKIW